MGFWARLAQWFKSFQIDIGFWEDIHESPGYAKVDKGYGIRIMRKHKTDVPSARQAFTYKPVCGCTDDKVCPGPHTNRTYLECNKLDCGRQHLQYGGSRWEEFSYKRRDDD